MIHPCHLFIFFSIEKRISLNNTANTHHSLLSGVVFAEFRNIVFLFLEKATRKGKKQQSAFFNNYFRIKTWVERLKTANIKKRKTI